MNDNLGQAWCRLTCKQTCSKQLSVSDVILSHWILVNIKFMIIPGRVNPRFTDSKYINLFQLIKAITSSKWGGKDLTFRCQHRRPFALKGKARFSQALFLEFKLRFEHSVHYLLAQNCFLCLHKITGIQVEKTHLNYGNTSILLTEISDVSASPTLLQDGTSWDQSRRLDFHR